MSDRKYLDLAEPSVHIEGGFWGKLKRGLAKSQTELLGRLEAVFSGGIKLDDDAIERLEEALISADLG